ncbi:tetratricopeptide repeat (TPR)-like superfamily protein [Wolffia australiana]
MELARRRAAMIEAWASSPSPSGGLAIHALLLKTLPHLPPCLSSKLLSLHLRQRRLPSAPSLLLLLPRPAPLPAFNALLSAFARRGPLPSALLLLSSLPSLALRPDPFTLSIALSLPALPPLLLHPIALKLPPDPILATALVHAYARRGLLAHAARALALCGGSAAAATALVSACFRRGLVADAEAVFAAAPGKDAVSFNAMIDGYAASPATAAQAVAAFMEMQRAGLAPTASTFASLVDACSVLCRLELGRQVHGRLVKTAASKDVRAGTAALDMYAKCGRTEEARRVFEEMVGRRNVVTWSAMVDGYGKNGEAEAALTLFREMEEEADVAPNGVTFLAVLSACGHGGMIDQGKEILKRMERPGMEHYACVVDMIGRSGRLREAFEFIGQMPCRAGDDVWAALLGACRLHGEVELADVAAKELLARSGKARPGAYMALSNAFAEAGRWRSVCEVREMMKARGVAKITGNSCSV